MRRGDRAGRFVFIVLFFIIISFILYLLFFGEVRYLIDGRHGVSIGSQIEYVDIPPINERRT